MPAQIKAILHLVKCLVKYAVTKIKQAITTSPMEKALARWKLQFNNNI